MKSFSSFAGFALHLAEVVAAQDENDHAMLERIGKAVEKRAKAKIGDYQDQAGPFVAWAALADATMADRERQGYPEDEPLLRGGDLRDSIEHQASAREAEIGSDSDIAVYQELGTNAIPPRSFLGGALFELAPQIVEECGEGLLFALEGKGVFKGRMTIEP